MSQGSKTKRLELIACDGCGRHFATDDGPGMIAAIVGPCPDCGGRFQLLDSSSPEQGSAARDALRARRGTGPGARSPADLPPGRSASA